MRSRRHTSSRGYVLPAVLLFLTIAFGIWAVVFRSCASVLRVEQARSHRATRTQWSMPATAAGLRLLETGNPPASPYDCKLAVTQDSQTKYFHLTYEQVSSTRYTLSVAPTDADDVAPDAPSTFAVPLAPAGLTALTFSQSQINLAWTDVADETGYSIERSPDGTSNWTAIGTTGANVTTFAATGLSASTTYYFRVAATNSNGNGNCTGVVSATTQDVGSPNAPTDLIVDILSATSVRLTWTDNASNENGFRIQRSTDGSSWTNNGTVAADVTLKDMTGLTAGQLYYFRVRANGAGADSAWSNAVTVTPN